MVKRWLLMGILTNLLFWLGGCASQEPTTDPVTGLTTLHRSTFRRMVNNADRTAMVFADGTRAIVAEDLWKHRRLFLIDLENGTTRTLELPDELKQTSQAFLDLNYAGDVVVASFDLAPVQENKHVVLLIDGEGQIKRLQQLNSITGRTTEEPLPHADDLETYLRDGKLDGLTRLQKEICKRDPATGIERVTKNSIVEYFFNDESFVETNISTMRERLAENSLKKVVDSCEMRAPKAPVGYEIEIERTGGGNESHVSDADSRIMRAVITRNGQVVKDISFDLKTDFLFYAVSHENRVYFVGNYVKYLELPPASP